MINLLAAETGGNLGWTIALIVLIVLMIVYLIFGTINRKKQQEEAMKMLNNLKTGDKIVTNAGIYGEIVSQKETSMGKIVVIKTGEDGGKVSYLTINASVILGIDEKQDLILDENGNVVEPDVAKEQVLKKTGESKEDSNKSNSKNDSSKNQESINEDKKSEGNQEKKSAKENQSTVKNNVDVESNSAVESTKKSTKKPAKNHKKKQ